MSSLEVVQKYRRNVRDGKAQELREALFTLEEEVARLSGLEKSREMNSRNIAARQIEGTASEALRQYYEYREHLRFEIERQNDTVTRALAAVEDRKRAVAEATRDSKIMDTAVARREDERRRALSRAEQKMLDDVATNVYLGRMEDRRSG